MQTTCRQGENAHSHLGPLGPLGEYGIVVFIYVRRCERMVAVARGVGTRRLHGERGPRESGFRRRFSLIDALHHCSLWSVDSIEPVGNAGRFCCHEPLLKRASQVGDS